MNKHAKTIATVRKKELYFREHVEKNASVCSKQNNIKIFEKHKSDADPLQMLKSNFGITLIALIITIIVLLILAGVTLNMVIGENGIFGKANWAKFVANISQAEEAERLSSMNSMINKALNEENNENGYKIGEKYSVEKNSTLEKTIYAVNGSDYDYEEYMYEVKKSELNLNGIKEEYIIDINTGKVYQINAYKKDGKFYHIPEIGITKDGNSEEEKDTIPPTISDITAEYDSDNEMIKIEVVASDNKSTELKYVYNIKNKTTNKEITTDKLEESEYIVSEDIEAGEYEIKVDVYDEAGNKSTSDVKNLTVTKLPEATPDMNFTISDMVVTLNKKVSPKILNSDTGKQVSNSSFSWKIDNEEIAIIKNYNITGKTVGETTVTATLKSDTTKKRSAKVTVVDLVSEIYTIEDLELFRSQVNAGNSFEGITVEQCADIDLQGTEENQWLPIGTYSRPFDGTYNGNGYSISNLYYDSTSELIGLFLHIKDAEIKNVTLKNVNIKTTKYRVGGIAAESHNSIIDNCKIYGKIIATGNRSVTGGSGSLVGGIVGYTGDKSIIKNCINNSDISGYSYAGGITGDLRGNSNVNNCINYGKINSEGASTGGNCLGGIIGATGHNNEAGTTSNVTKCLNFGVVEGTSRFVGGIVGSAACITNISECANMNEITTTTTSTGERKIGGIVGHTTKGYVKNCYNTGKIYIKDEQKGTNLGGIVGTITNAGFEVSYCYNAGEVKSYNNTGGIVGYLSKTPTTATENYYIDSKINNTLETGKKTEFGTPEVENTIKSLYNKDTWNTFIKQNTNQNVNSGFPIFIWQ